MWVKCDGTCVVWFFSLDSRYIVSTFVHVWLTLFGFLLNSVDLVSQIKKFNHFENAFVNYWKLKRNFRFGLEEKISQPVVSVCALTVVAVNELWSNLESFVM